ncbi:cyclophilin-like protein [Lichtheimia hyalospora FSU 10163]|nr:cyclophilin-like protein [Lichtheimia hyalospora FSU 10163]
MSSVYTLEPHTNGKVILHTTAGDIEIELWGKETPKTCRNFIQLCMEGYYDNTIFHRMVPGFIVQGGDPTGTGQGGESIYEDEDEFPNEYHSRLRFNRRGLVGMANTGEGTAGSQFFFTLDRADELDKTHTLFGRVVGDTVYNVIQMGEMEVDVNERPLYPPKVKTTEIVLNPFDDIVPRITEREKKLARAREMEKAAAEEQAKKKKKKEKKKLNLLSFGEEAAEMEPEEGPKKSKKKSAYDFLPDDKQVSVPMEEKPKAEQKPESTTTIQPEKRQPEQEISEQPPKKKHKEEEKKPFHQEEQQPTKSEPISEYEKLKQDIRKMERDRRDEIEGRWADHDTGKKKKLSLIEQQREKYARRGVAKIGGVKERKKKDVDDTFSKLLAFQKKLSTAEPEIASSKKPERPPCKLHLVPNCESCYDTTQDDVEEETDQGWMSHKLVFDKDRKGKDLMQRNETVDDYLVIDPRARKAEADQQERDKRKEKQSHLGEAFRSKKERGYDDDRKRHSRDRDGRRHYDDRKRSRDDSYHRRR